MNALTDETIEYASGHKCEPNGVGDYTMICPTRGPYPSFIPYMWARNFVCDKVCALCEQTIGPRVDLPA